MVQDRVIRLVVDEKLLTPQIRAWLFSSLLNLPQKERVQQIQSLEDEAASCTDADRLHILGNAFFMLSDPQMAYVAFDKAARLQPGDVRNTINTAVMLVHTDQLGRAIARLRQLEEAPHELAETARHYLRLLEQGKQDQEQDLELKVLQMSALREKAEQGAATPDERRLLAEKLLEVASWGDKRGDLRQASSVLEDLLAANASDTRVLELLVSVSTLLHDNEKLSDAVSRLERLDPQSPFLKAYDRIQSPSMAPAQDLTVRRLEQLIQDLSRTVQEDGPEREPALGQLRGLVARFPANPSYKYELMLAESITDNEDRATRLARELHEMVQETQDPVSEYNIAACLANGGFLREGELHFQAALDQTQDPEERSRLQTILDRHAQVVSE